jgi:hypothetical protein
MMVTMGSRQSLGLFIGPIEATTGMGIASISLALAIGQSTGAPSSRWLVRWPIATAHALC